MYVCISFPVYLSCGLVMKTILKDEVLFRRVLNLRVLRGAVDSKS